MKKAEWSYSFYHVNTDLHIGFNNIDTISSEYTAILLIDYFGMTDLSDDVLKIRKLLPDITIIVDCVQAYYSLDKYDAEYSFTSFRKWFPCPNGAIVKKRAKGSMIDLELKDGTWWQYKYAGNILKSFNQFVKDDIILALLEKGEDYLDEDFLCKWDNASKEVYLSIDKEGIKSKRRENAKYLHENLLDMNIKHIYSEEGTPLFVPIFVNDRDELRKEFYAENIFTPKHWPNTYNLNNELYVRELSLICDQRYEIDDMELQLKVLQSRKK